MLSLNHQPLKERQLLLLFVPCARYFVFISLEDQPPKSIPTGKKKSKNQMKLIKGDDQKTTIWFFNTPNR